AAEREPHRVERCASRRWTALAEAGGAQEHEARIDGAELGRAEAPALERPGPEVLDDHVARSDEIEKHLSPSRRAHVERDAPLVAVGHREARAPAARPIRAWPARGRKLDHDPLGAEVAEQGGRRRA